MMTLLRPESLLLLAFALPAPLAAQPQANDTARRTRPGLPLAPARTVSATVSRGTWMSLDVSPDGRTIVFDLLGDLYTLPIAGGTATRLTSGMAYDAQPRFSPDGRRIAFTSDRSGGDNVWITSLDGRDTTQVTRGNNNGYISPEWTPDGQYLVVTRTGGGSGGNKLWLYHVHGGAGVQLVRGANQLTTIGAAFGADPRYVWFATRQGTWSYNAILPQYQLAVYDRETGSQTAMSARYGSAFRPALSPDGRWLAYGSRHDAETGLRLRDLASGEERWLAYPIQRDNQEAYPDLDVLPGYAFTPDSRAVVTSYGGELWRVPVDGSAPARIPFTASLGVPVGPEVRFDYAVDDGQELVARQIRDPGPSPDGRRVAFSALNHVWVMDLPAGTPRRLTRLADGEFFPTWSPDGQWLAFVTWTDEGGHLYKARADGRGDPQRLTAAAATYYQPAWSPDGGRIVAMRADARELQETLQRFGGGMGARFVWVPAAGGAVTTIALASGRRAPHFTADSTRIYAYGSDGLLSFRWDGSDEKVHVKVTGANPPGATGDPPQASLVLMAPRGDQALAQVGQHLFAVTVPVVGGQVPTVSTASPDGAIVPIRQLTDIGGEFPAWSADGRKVHWAIGNAFVTYDLDRARALEDSVRAAARARPAADTGRAAADSARPARAQYKPDEVRIRVTGARDVPQGALVLRGGRALTMRGREIVENADVVVVNNRIAAVGPRGRVSVPQGARIIDVTGTTVLPGFVDTHAHFRHSPGVHNAQPWALLANLAYGVTTTRDPQTGTTDVLSYADRVEAGEVLGPRVYSTGPGVFAGERIRDLDHARNVLKRYSEYYDTKTIKMYGAGNRQQRQWIIMAARELQLMPTTEGSLQHALDLTHAMDGYAGIEHNLPIVPLYEDVIELLRVTQTTTTPTLLVSYGGPWAENYWYTRENVHGDRKLRQFTPEAELDAKTRRRGQGAGGSPGPGGWFLEDEYAFRRHAGFIRDLVEAGGRAGIGSHGQLQGLGYHWELWTVQAGGLAPHDALRVATIMGAEAIGLGQQLGSLEGGKLADLVVLDGDPLADIRNTNTIRYVVKNGRVYEGDTLNEVWPRQRPLPPMPWRHTEPAPAAGLR